MSAITSSGTARAARHGFTATVAICAAFGLIAWGFSLWLFRIAPLQDWMVFYEAARAYFTGNLPLIFDGNALTAALNQRFAGWLGAPLGLHPWVYPPPFLLLILPFGLLPPVASAAAFLLVGLAVAVAVMWRSLDPAQRWPAIGTLLLCPAVPFDVMTGQNAFYTAALLVGGFAAMAEAPVLAGVLIGLVSLKPQLALLAWVALVAARQWRVLAAAVATGGVLVAASVVVFGLDIWQAWTRLVLGGGDTYRSWIDVGRLNGISVYACANWLGLPPAAASLAQATATIGSAALIYTIYRRPGPAGLRLAALLAAAILAAPHASNSDAILLGLAAAIFVTSLPRETLQPYQLAVAAAVWISPLFNPPVLFRIGCATPLLVAALLAAIVVALRGPSAAGAAR
jgi:hypothetical protein